MLTPDEIEGLSGPLLDKAAKIEAETRAKMADGVSKAINSGHSNSDKIIRDILADGQKVIRESSKVISDTMADAASTALGRDEAAYSAARAAGVIGPYEPYSDSAVLGRILADGISTAADLNNLVMTAALNSMSAEYSATVDAALLRMLSGAQTPQHAIAEAVENIARTTTHITFRTAAGQEVRSTIYAAVRRNVMTGANQATLRMQEARMREVGAKWVEISAHSGARPEHAEWQGEIMLFEDLPAKTGYGDVAGLGGANCRHSFSPYFPGIMEPADYSHLDSRDGQEDYDLSQRQRTAERNIRTYSAREAVYSAAGDAAQAERNAALAQKWRAQARDVARKRSGAVRRDRQAIYPGEERI